MYGCVGQGRLVQGNVVFCRLMYGCVGQCRLSYGCVGSYMSVLASVRLFRLTLVYVGLCGR